MAFFCAKFIRYCLFFYGQLWFTNGNELPMRCNGGTTRMYCYPVVPSFIHFYGWDLPYLEYLSVSNARDLKWSLQTLPSGLFNLASNIRYLDIDAVGLENLKCDIFEPLMYSLKFIRMDNNLFREFPSCAFKHLNRLERIHFRNQNLESVNMKDLQLYSLIDIDFTKNRISNFSIFNINNINDMRISLDENKISFLNISRVSRIQFLSAKNNRLTTIYVGIFQNSHSTLEYLDLSYNALDDDLWMALEGVTAIGKLKLAQNKLQTVNPYVISRLSELNYLDLSYNYISSLTDVLLRSGKMTIVLFNSNKLVNMPPNLIDGTKTFSDAYDCILDISSNMIDNLHFNIPIRPRGLRINFGHNALTAIHFKNYAEQSININNINMSNNCLVNLPETLPKSKLYAISNNPLNTTNVLHHLTTTMKEATYIEMDNINFLCNTTEHYDLKNLQLSKLISFSLIGNCIPLSFLCYIGNRTIYLYLDNNKNHYDSAEIMPCEIHTKVFNIVSFSGSRTNENLIHLFTSKYIKTIANVTSLFFKKSKLRELPFIRYSKSSNYGNSVFDFSENLLEVFNGMEISFLRDRFILNLEHNHITQVKKVVLKNTFDDHDFWYIHADIYLKYMNNSVTDVNDCLIWIDFISKYPFTTYLSLSIDLSFNELYDLDLTTIFHINQGNFTVRMAYLNASHNDLHKYRNCLKSVDASFGILDLTYNKLRELPNESCRYAFETYLGHNSITNISTTLPKASVTKLDLEWNFIHYIHNDAFINMTSLTTLSLTGNKLESFPKAVHAMHQLTTLDISYNKMTNIKQSDIDGKMKSLTSLILTGNNLANLPALSNEIFNPFEVAEITDNVIYCYCDMLFLRNHTLNTQGRCSFPTEFEGYLVSCFPVNKCVGNVPIFVYKETRKMCLYDDYFDIRISLLKVDEILSVRWKRLGPKKQTAIKMIAKRKQIIVKEILVNESGRTNSFFLPCNLNTDLVCIHAFLIDRSVERCEDVNHINIISKSNSKYVTVTNSHNVVVYVTSTVLLLSVILNILGSIYIYNFITRKRPTNHANSNRLNDNVYVPNGYEISSGRGDANDQQLQVYIELSENTNRTGIPTYENLNI